MRVELALGDLTAEDTDAIVNAANSSLAGGGGVDGAIHRAACPQLSDACRELRRTEWPGGLPPGEAVATPGFDLPARWVIHTVGPVWSEAQADRRRPLLASCHVRALAVADALGARTVAFPAISTGVYGWPLDDAARVSVDAVRAATTGVDLVRFVLFSPAAYDSFAAAAS